MYRCQVAPSADTIEAGRAKSKRRRRHRRRCGRGHPCPRKSAPPEAGMPRPTFATRSPEPTVGRWPEHPAPGKSDPELAMPEADPPQAESSGHIPLIDKAPSGGSGRAARCLPGRALQVKETSADFSMADACLARDKPYMADPATLFQYPTSNTELPMTKERQDTCHGNECMSGVSVFI